MARQAKGAATRRSISLDSPRKRMKDKRRVQLIEANMASIAERGLTDTTITHVSEGAGMSRGIINFYFDSKETMMRETLAYLLEEQAVCRQQAMEKTAGATGREKLEALLTALFSNRICTRKKLAVWAAFVAHAATHAPYRFQILQAATQLRGQLEDILKDIAGTRPQAADQALALIDGLWMAQILSDTMRDRKELVALCMNICEPVASIAAPAKSKVAPLPLREEKKPALPVKPGRKSALKPRAENEEAPVVADLFAAL